MSMTNINLDELRISPEDGDYADIGDDINPTSIRKPHRQHYFRAHPDVKMRADINLLWYEPDSRWYIVRKPLWISLADELTLVKLVACIDFGGDLFLWPIKHGSSDGRANGWKLGALAAVDAATKRWVRLIPDMRMQKYRHNLGSEELAEPEWPEKSLSDLVNEAFTDAVIDTLEHPVVKKLRGIP